MTKVLDLQFVAHLYIATDGPGAVASYRALTDIWHGCRTLFGMTEPVPGVGLPNVLPESPEAIVPGREVALAAQERPGADFQVVLRTHYDVLNLSLVLAPPETSAPRGGDWSWWRTIDEQWNALIAPYTPHLLGEARLYLARTDAEADIQAAAPTLYERLSELLPAGVASWRGQQGVPVSDALAFWETTSEPDERSLRRFVLAIAPYADADASAWVWSRGDTAIPPLARYLLHAAKLRYQLRIVLRDNTARQLHASLDTLGGELRRLGASDSAKAELLRLRRLDALLLLADLRAVQQTVRSVADNLGRALDLSRLMVPHGPFADDADLVRWMLELLDDETAYLGMATDQAEHVLELRPTHQPDREPHLVEHVAPPKPPSPDGDRKRNVFVVYGRDEPARRALFAFLRSLGLRPLEWEHLVSMTGKTTPSLSEVVTQAMPQVQAVVVLLTPEDIVRLHPDLHDPHEANAETHDTLQARPNVLLELGMALAVRPKHTLVLVIGEQRPITDLGGLNYIRITENTNFLSKIVTRLHLAGCHPDISGQDWLLVADDFAALAAHHRAP